MSKAALNTPNTEAPPVSRAEFEALLNVVQEQGVKIKALSDQVKESKSGAEGTGSLASKPAPKQQHQGILHKGKTYFVTPNFLAAGRVPSEKGYIPIDKITDEQMALVVDFAAKNPKIKIFTNIK